MEIAGSTKLGEATRAGLELHVVHASLVRPILFAGAEPSAVVIEVGIAGALLFGVGFKLVTVVLAALYLTIGHGFLRWVAKQDPYMIQLYLRSLGGKDFYPPHALARAPVPTLRASIPRVGNA